MASQEYACEQAQSERADRPTTAAPGRVLDLSVVAPVQLKARWSRGALQWDNVDVLSPPKRGAQIEERIRQRNGEALHAWVQGA